MKKKYIEASELPDGERVYLKKDMFGWRTVQPLTIDGKFQWKNFFALKGFVMLVFLLLLLGFGYLAYGEQIQNYKRVMSNPCPYCKDCQDHCRQILTGIKTESIPFENINYSLHG